jgi:hypothetical protein
MAVLHTLQPKKEINMVLPELDAFLADTAARKFSLSKSAFKSTCNFPNFSAAELPYDLDARWYT